MSRPEHPPEIQPYLHRIYAPEQRAFACDAQSPNDVAAWQREARAALRELIRLDVIGSSMPGHVCNATLDPVEDCGDYTRQRGGFAVEPDVTIPFWLLRPKGDGPFPLALTPHGHDALSFNVSAGIPRKTVPMEMLIAEDRDVAVQAVRNGFVAISPATRGIARGSITDVDGRYANNCRAHSIHALMAGRTAMGERVWDMMRLIDWATERDDVDSSRVLMLGNSGGGVLTAYAAACDERINIAVPSCAFNAFVTDDGRPNHCDCNLVPGIMRWGEMWDLAGLIAPRHLLIVNGRDDGVRAGDQVDRAVAHVRRIYEAANASLNFDMQYGQGGHRFYKSIMWPFINRTLQAISTA